MEWKPIETAPKDGTIVLLCGGEPDPLHHDSDEDHPERYTRPVTGWWGPEVEWVEENTIWRFCSFDSGIYGEYVNPTHWMPLPPPPSR